MLAGLIIILGSVGICIGAALAAGALVLMPTMLIWLYTGNDYLTTPSVLAIFIGAYFTFIFLLGSAFGDFLSGNKWFMEKLARLDI